MRSMISHKILFGIFFGVAVFVSLTRGLAPGVAQVVPNHLAQTQLAQNHESEISRVILDYTPLMRPSSTFLIIDAKGGMRAVSYRRNQLLVQEDMESVVRPEGMEGIAQFTKDPSFMTWLRAGVDPEPAPQEGDVYHLAVRNGTDSDLVQSGSRGNAPEAAQSFLDYLLDLSTGGAVSSLAEAYLRAERIPAERFEALQRNGLMEAHSLDVFSEPMQSSMKTAFRRPLEFIPITEAQREELLSRSSHGDELFVLDQGTGFQLTPYSVIP